MINNYNMAETNSAPEFILRRIHNTTTSGALTVRDDHPILALAGAKWLFC
ncbi:hypothetical protein [Synechococcus sp. M16CYN]